MCCCFIECISPVGKRDGRRKWGQSAALSLAGFATATSKSIVLLVESPEKRGEAAGEIPWEFGKLYLLPRPGDSYVSQAMMLQLRLNVGGSEALHVARGRPRSGVGARFRSRRTSSVAVLVLDVGGS